MNINTYLILEEINSHDEGVKVRRENRDVVGRGPC